MSLTILAKYLRLYGRKCFCPAQYSPDTIHWDVWGAQYNIRSSWLPSSNNIGLIIFWNAWILNNIRVWKINIFLTNCLRLVFPPPSTLQTLYIEMYEVLNTTFEVHGCPSSNNIELIIFWNAWILYVELIIMSEYNLAINLS